MRPSQPFLTVDRDKTQEEKLRLKPFIYNTDIEYQPKLTLVT